MVGGYHCRERHISSTSTDPTSEVCRLGGNLEAIAGATVETSARTVRDARGEGRTHFSKNQNHTGGRRLQNCTVQRSPPPDSSVASGLGFQFSFEAACLEPALGPPETLISCRNSLQCCDNGMTFPEPSVHSIRTRLSLEFPAPAPSKIFKSPSSALIGAHLFEAASNCLRSSSHARSARSESMRILTRRDQPAPLRCIASVPVVPRNRNVGVEKL